MPIVQEGRGAIVFGISTIITCYLVIKILINKLYLTTFPMKYILSTILILTISFSFVSSNSGVTSRYRFCSVNPLLYIAYVNSCISKKKVTIKLNNDFPV